VILISILEDTHVGVVLMLTGAMFAEEVLYAISSEGCVAKVK
jgi:hypothetical protein